MTFTTIEARYPGKCQRCGGKVHPGDRVRYAKGRTWHMASECAAALERDGAPIAAAAMRGEQVALSDLAAEGQRVRAAASGESDAALLRGVLAARDSEPVTAGAHGFRVEAMGGVVVSAPTALDVLGGRSARAETPRRVRSLISSAFEPAPEPVTAHVELPEAPELPAFTDAELEAASEGREVGGDVMRELLAGFVAKAGAR